MRLFFIFAILSIVSCGAQNDRPKYGSTTVNELISTKGEPIKEEVIPVDDSKVLHYGNGDKYQVSSEIVQIGYRNPTNTERNLIYWQHAFRDCDVKIIKVTEKKISHEPQEFIMRCESMGLGVVYTENSEFISRVVEYAPKK